MTFPSKSSTTYSVKKRYPSISEFRNAINGINRAYSIRDNIPYVNISVTGSDITGMRESTGKTFNVPLEALFKAQSKVSELNTTILKEYIVTRAQSPAMAILKGIGVI